MLFVKQPLIFHFLGHKSAATCQVAQNKISNSKLKTDRCSNVRTETMLRLFRSNHTNKAQFFGTPITSLISWKIAKMKTSSTAKVLMFVY